jgi:electron transport complex protein RnfD
MLQLLFALVPAIIALGYFFGAGVYVNILFAVSLALITEAAMLKLRNRPIKPFITDGSAIVTAVLLAVAIPPLSPWWLTAVGILFAIVFGKHLYGGLGYNPFNPAMLAYVLLLVSFPLEMTTWLPANELAQQSVGFNTALELIFSGSHSLVDTYSGATPLDMMKTQIGLEQMPVVVMNQPLFGMFGGIGWEWINLWFAVGGLFLIFRKVISWHIPVAMLSTILVMSGITYLIAPEVTADPLFHLLSGGTMIGAFFIATDPVTAATSLKGRILFGAGVGFFTYVIRVWGGYPDGVAFAVLLMNMLVPLIDYYTQPKVYGASK